MFREASAIDSERTAASVRSLYAKYSGNNNWFDGSPDSVDRRIAQAKKISNLCKAASVRLSGRNASSQYIALAHEMDSDRTALEGLRRDLLTAAADRDDEFGWTPAYQPEKARYRAEARHFIAEQECDDLRELTIRAKNYAEKISSTLTSNKSSKFIQAFVQAVRHEYQPPKQYRTAANTAIYNFPADLMYLE